jgi:hypothetical protein
LHRRLKHAAIDAGTTLQAFIIKILEEHVDHDGVAAAKGAGNHGQREQRGR